MYKHEQSIFFYWQQYKSEEYHLGSHTGVFTDKGPIRP
jgi:hypothetical protein